MDNIENPIISSTRRTTWLPILLGTLLPLLTVACDADSELSLGGPGDPNAPQPYDSDNPNAPWDSTMSSDPWDTNRPPSSDGNDTHTPNDSSTSSNPGNDTQSPDTDPVWTLPQPKQAALARFDLQCDPQDLITGTRPNAENYCHASKVDPCVPYDYRIDCTLKITDGNGDVHYNDFVSIRRRGRSSRNYHKPSYNFEMQTSGGDNNPAPLLGMGKEQDWILDGSWMDRSFMRNNIVSDIFRKLGPRRWAPKSRFGQMTFNGQAQGIYRLVEKIKRDDDRIDITEDDGTGESFVLKQDDDGDMRAYLGLERTQGNFMNPTSGNNTWKLVYPHRDRASTAQRQNIQNWLNAMANAIPQGQAFNYLDIDTTVDWILLQEFAKNIDGYMLSMFFYKDRNDANGKAHIVPWDFDLSMGQPGSTQFSNNPSAEGFSRQTNNTNQNDSFILGLAKDPALAPALAQRWQELRQGPFSKEYIDAHIDNYLLVLRGQAITDNFSLWPISQVTFQHIWTAYTLYSVSSFEDEVAKWRQWIYQRLEWLDANIHTFPG
ncbi:MAG: hypothetical protein GX146_03125 [Myxococcales bacterium]|nr:hypothetical protein [Myxococcales bacterium]